MAYRVALADDQPQVLESVRRILSHEQDLEIVIEAQDGLAFLESLRKSPVVPDLLIVDITMPGLGGIEVVRQAKVIFPETRVLILTMHEEEEYLAQAMSAGASGYLLKDDAGQELISAINQVRAGRTYISAYFRAWYNLKTGALEADTPGQVDKESQTGTQNGSARRAQNGSDPLHPPKPHV